MSTGRTGAALLSLVLGASLLAPVDAHAGVHVRVTTYAVSAEPDSFGLSTDAGDFDGDDRLDLATAALSMGGGDVTVLFGRGGGAFAAGQVFESDPRPGSIATGDFDEDGRSDLLLPSDVLNRVTVMYGNGDESFDADFIDVGGPTNDVAVGDFNGDSHLDAAVASPGSVSLLLGHGATGMDDPVAYATGGAGYGAIGAGDFNDDGRDDIAATPSGASNDGIGVLLGKADGTLEAPVVTTLSSCCAATAIAVGRFDANQRADVVVTPHAVLGVPSVLLAQPDGKLGAPAGLPATGFGPAIGDANGDGTSDLAFGESGVVRTLVGHGNGTFSSFATLPTPVQLVPQRGVELNGDPFSDLVLTDASSGILIVALNAPFVTASARSVPFGPAAVGARSPSRRVTITNDGQPPLAISSVATAGANAADFRVARQTCAGRTLTAGARCEVDVDSAPTAAGARTADIVIESNGVESVYRIPLSTTGVQAGSGTVDTTPPEVNVTFARQKLRAVLRRGLKLRAGCSEACRLRLRVRLTRSLARGLHLPAGVVAARGSATLTRKGTVRVALKLKRRVRRRLSDRRRAQFVLRLIASDPAGNQTTVTRTRRVKR